MKCLKCYSSKSKNYVVFIFFSTKRQFVVIHIGHDVDADVFLKRKTGKVDFFCARVTNHSPIGCSCCSYYSNCCNLRTLGLHTLADCFHNMRNYCPNYNMNCYRRLLLLCPLPAVCCLLAPSLPVIHCN